MKDEYELLPTRRKVMGSPPGWVTLDPKISHPKRRTMTEGYLNQRLPRNNTVAMNQHYVQKVLDNPRTPAYNRQVVIDYVNDHPDKFMPLCDTTDSPEVNEWARKKNGNAEHGFIARIRQSRRS